MVVIVVGVYAVSGVLGIAFGDAQINMDFASRVEIADN